MLRGRAQQATSTDLRLARQVADQLRQQLPQGQNVQPIQPQSIYVMVRQGTVTLHGYVQSSSQKQQAEQIVQSIQGVQNIQNDLTILSTRGTAGQGGGPMESQQGAGGTSGQTSSDRRLAQAVQQQIQNQFPDANINVTASQGTITLRGTVQDDNAKQEAEQIAQSISGVQSVQNNLRVGSQGGSFQPQGYIPGQSSQSQQGQSQQGMSSQDQSSSQRQQPAELRRHGRSESVRPRQARINIARVPRWAVDRPGRARPTWPWPRRSSSN